MKYYAELFIADYFYVVLTHLYIVCLMWVIVFTDNYLPDILYHGLHGSVSFLSDVRSSDYGARQATLCSPETEELKVNRY